MESLILENRIPRIISHPVIVRFDRYASNRPGGDEKSGISEMDRGRGGGDLKKSTYRNDRRINVFVISL